MTGEPTGAEAHLDAEKANDRAALPATIPVRLRALDTVVRLDVVGDDVAARLRLEWSRCLVDEPDSAEVSIPVNPAGRDIESLTYVLASEITRVAVEAAVGRYLMFHACGLVDDHGRTVVLVAPSGTGKTTAAASLARSDFGYLTDEAVAITSDGRVLPYPKPLSIVRTTSPKAQRSPDELGLRPCPPDPRLSALVLLERVEGELVPRLERLTIPDAILALIPQTSALPSLDRPLQRLREAIERCGGAYRLRYSEISGANDALLALARRDATRRDVPPETSTQPPVRPEGEPANRPPADAEAVGRSDVRDVVETGDEAIILSGNVPVRVSGVGLTIWRAAGVGAAMADLVEAAVREHGPHPNADALVHEAVARMVEVGVLRATRREA